MIELFDYQKKLVDDFDDALASGFRRPLIVLPTGGGKTLVASHIIREWRRRYKRNLFAAHRDELLLQCRDKLRKFDVDDAGLIKAGREKDSRPMSMVQIGSIQTLYSRCLRDGATGELLEADIVWIDEAHRGRAMTYQKLVAAFPNAVIAGLTATPVRGDGLGLGNVFDCMLQGPTVAELIEQGYLCKLRIFAPAAPPNLKGVATAQGDYVISQLSERMNTKLLIGDFILHWLRHAERRKTVVYACSVGHSVDIVNEMLESGIRAAHLDGSTPQDEREQILAQLASGEIEVVSNCNILTEGYDLPDMGCIGLCRPTKSLGLHLQMCGRGLRTAPGKENVIILDHAGNMLRHGRPDDDITWTLESDQRAINKKHQARLQQFPDNPWVECKQCGEQRMRGEACPNCGYRPKPPPRAVDVIDADLAEMGAAQRAALDRKRFYLELRGYAATARSKKTGQPYKASWAAQQYRSKFQIYPPWNWNDEPPIEPSPETRRWIRSRIIAWARAQG
jgi:DNA repair protein RadD